MLVSLAALALAGLACMPAGAGAFSASQARYLKAANQGVKQTNRWWNRGRRWYSSVMGGSNQASLWGVVPLFEALAGLQIAAPSSRHLHQLNRFAWGAQRYLNPTLEPVPGFGPRPRQHEPGKTTWFDDNGWWGLAFLDAYRATGNGRYLTDAEIAQNFISVSGWDNTPGRPGGIWWNTNHSFYAGESLASGTLLSARLFAITHDKHYLDDATKFIDWANVWLVDPTTGLYARLRKPGTYGKVTTVGSDTAERYVPRAGGRRRCEGAIGEPGRGSEARGRRHPGSRSGRGAGVEQLSAVRRLADAVRERPDDPGPPDHLRPDRQEVLLPAGAAAGERPPSRSTAASGWVRSSTSGTCGRCSSSPRRTTTANWYGIVQRSARSALHRAHDKHGLYLRTWYGKKASRASSPKGSLQLHAANAALFAWMAALGR